MTQTPPHSLDLAAIEAQVRRHGPTRVLVDAQGTAYGPIKAQREGALYETVLVRNDGWTLGAPAWLLETARALWAGQWVHEFSVRDH